MFCLGCLGYLAVGQAASSDTGATFATQRACQPRAAQGSGVRLKSKSFGSYVAAACEISVKDGNKIKIHRIVAATDPGYVVNPAQIKRQVSGSFVYGLSALFEEEITIKNGAVIQKNFDTFGSIRLAQMPPVETIIIQGGGTVWGGVGEPTICVAAPAVLNAFFKATGKRIRTLPLKIVVLPSSNERSSILNWH